MRMPCPPTLVILAPAPSTVTLPAASLMMMPFPLSTNGVAGAVSRTLPPGGHPGCAVSGRKLLVHLVLPEGGVSYLLEPRPDPIWRGQALLRCGPAYDLSGERSNGAVVSRVLVDGLRQEGLILQTAASGLLQVELQRGWMGSAGRELRFDGRIHAAVATELEG